MKIPRDIVLLCLTSLSISLPTQIAAQTLDFSKAWFKPLLTQNKDTVCASLLAMSQQEFFAFPNSSPTDDNTEGPIPNTPDWVLQHQHYAEPILVNGNQVYERGFVGRGCGGACETEFLGLSKTPFTEMGGYSDGWTFSQDQTTTLAQSTGLYKHRNASYYGITKGATINVYKMLPDATWNKVCEITSTPSEATYNQIPDIYSSIKKLNLAVNNIIGEEGSYCGSMHTLSRWKQFINQGLQETLYRPWALRESATDESTYAIDFDNLQSWSLKDITQKLAFDDYQKQLAITTKDLSQFYQKNYQWPATISDDMATRAMKAAISSGIRFYQYDQPSRPQKTLITAITDRQPMSVIKPLADAPDALANINLSIAIYYPQALEMLLAKGGNSNQQNAFNKTLLMYAAQYNQLESAKILLSKGANPNLFTIIPDDTCNFTLSKSNMTALHYAVRYSSADFVKLLLKSGANPFASTSETTGGRPIDWLHKYTADNAPEKNPNLNKENIAELEKLLSMPSADEVARQVLGFNLAAEQAFQKGNLDDAYGKSLLALGLDEKNERALSNLSLILIKQGKPNEALEASNKLITTGKDVNQIANAWFNYGLICEKSTSHHVSYNGHYYCEDGALYPYLQSFKTKPTSGRADKILNLIKEKKGIACEFAADKNGLITLIQHCGSNSFCVLHSKERTIDLDTFALLKQSHENPNDLNSPVKISAVKPAKIVESFPLGNYQLTRLARSFGEAAVKFGDQICTESSELLPASKYP